MPWKVKNAPENAEFDAILVAVGRTPNGHLIAADKAGVQVDEFGFICVNEQQRTNVDHIYAIGDVVGQPMLAHKATHQAKVAAEAIAGERTSFSPMCIPSVAYTHPEIAWVGMTEKQLKAAGNEAYEKGIFPWRANGRAIACDATIGISKTLYCSQTKRILGAGIIGPNAGELIAEATLAIEMGATIEDLALTIHPHPTLSETIGLAAEVAHGSITDLPPPKKG